MNGRFRDNKDPSAILDYSIDWTEYLGSDGIAGATWSASSADLTVESSAISGNVTTARVSGGVVGSRYDLTCHVTLDSGQEDDRSINIVCVQR